MASDVVRLKEATTVNGQSLKVKAKKGVKVDNANVVKTDIVTSNGVIQPGGAGTIGILDVTGSLDSAGAIFIDIENGGVSPVPGTDYDQIAITGAME